MTNQELAGELKRLEDLLIIGGYPEARAAQYGRLAYTVSRLIEPVETLCKEGRLCEIPGVGPTNAALLSEYLATGSCKKRRSFERAVPATTLELLTIPGLGAKTVKRLYQECGIDSLNALARAIQGGNPSALRGIGARTLTTLRKYLAHRGVGQSDGLRLGLFAESELEFSIS